MNIGKVDLSANRAVVGQMISVLGHLSVGGSGSGHVAADFYDGDPAADGKLFTRQIIPYIRPNSSFLAKTQYRVSGCGTHSIYMRVGEGTGAEIVRRAAPLRVSCDSLGR